MTCDYSFRLEEPTVRPLRPLNRPGVHAQEELPHQAQLGKQTHSVGVCVLDMVWGKGPQQRNWRRPYTVCDQCSRWIWTDRIPARPFCNCGHKFPNHNHKVRPASNPQKQQQTSGKLEALPSAAQQMGSQIKNVLKAFVAGLPKDQKDSFLADFPEVGDKKSDKGDSDPFRKVSSSCAAAFREYKKLADRKHAIENKARKLQDQLDKLSEELARTTEDLDRAQDRHEQQLKTYATVVQQGPSASMCPEFPTTGSRPYDDDDEISNITGLDEMSDDKKEQRPSNEEDPTPTPTPTVVDPATQEAAQEQSQGSGGGRWTRHQGEQEAEEFTKFKETLSEEQREILERQLQKVSGTKQQGSKKTVQAQELMETARVMGGFLQSLQTVPSMYSG